MEGVHFWANNEGQQSCICGGAAHSGSTKLHLGFDGHLGLRGKVLCILRVTLDNEGQGGR